MYALYALAMNKLPPVLPCFLILDLGLLEDKRNNVREIYPQQLLILHTPYVLWIALTISFLVVGIAALSAILIIIPTFKPIVRTCFSNDSSTRRSQYLLRAEQHCSTSIGLSPRVHFSIDGFDCAWHLDLPAEEKQI
ncbi:hypothetical protein K435DRAFT_814519 [Dendrothele bispora CBS 962.96]|uniref:Uncharacterized protein n=1 Tax=Dendrothele bispora (strain CBS 962.96) TaxID=1314807 RepID=A0A4V4HAE5_DENBC|nr:hypothetical protein K435DRAFT_814519 [Dendrothele bispora CBS 962.96]